MTRGKTELPQQPDYTLADTFVIRAPLLPLQVLKDVSLYDQLDTLLKKYYVRPVVSEALFLASPELYRRADQYFDSNNGQEQDLRKLKLSLLKYLLRMSSRCTPFGMFAGISTGGFGPSTKMQISPPSKHTLKVKPDMQYLCTMAAGLIQDLAVREKAVFVPNNSLVMIGEEYRYVEYTTDKEGIRKYHLQKTPNTPELLKVLSKAKHGCSVYDLVLAFAGDKVDMQSVHEYLHALIDNQVLISSFEAMVSGSSYLEDLIEQLRSLEIEHETGDQLNEIDQLALKLEKKEHGTRVELLNKFIEVAQRNNDRLSDSTLIQADLKLSFEQSELSEQVRQDLVAILPVLRKFARPQKPYLLERFKESFQRRYDSKEMPLLQALDTEAGPGYLEEDKESNASSLLEGLLISAKKGAEEKIVWQETDRFLHRKLQQALLEGDKSINLDETELNSLPDTEIVLPLSFSIMTRIVGSMAGDPSHNMIHIDSAGGSSAANLAGRFCYLDDRLEGSIREITSIEQKLMGDEILAEIIHLPQQRTGNILMRPVLRDYEIPYLAREAVAGEYKIGLDDLMVSVVDDKVLLRSKRLDKFISPRMSNAHNYSMGSLPVYRFLCDLQYQGVCSNLGFSWGGIDRDSLFLPRVICRNIILHPSMWNLPVSEFVKFSEAKKAEDMLCSMQEIRLKYSIPEEILLCEGDNELWINLENYHCLSLLQNEIKSMDHIVLKEFLAKPDETLIIGENGAFANECLFFMHKSTG